jgi:hypothetical protein
VKTPTKICFNLRNMGSTWIWHFLTKWVSGGGVKIPIEGDTEPKQEPNEVHKLKMNSILHTSGGSGSSQPRQEGPEFAEGPRSMKEKQKKKRIPGENRPKPGRAPIISWSFSGRNYPRWRSGHCCSPEINSDNCRRNQKDPKIETLRKALPDLPTAAGLSSKEVPPIEWDNTFIHCLALESADFMVNTLE